MDALRQKARNLRNAGTDAERRLWQHLRLKQLGGCKFGRQVPVAGYVANFVCLEMKLIVELDGGQHVERAVYDARRTRVLEAEGYRVLRYWNDDVLVRTTEVLEDISRALELAKDNGKIKNKIKGTPPQSSPALCAREEAESNSEGDEA